MQTVESECSALRVADVGNQRLGLEPKLATRKIYDEERSIPGAHRLSVSWLMQARQTSLHGIAPTTSMLRTLGGWFSGTKEIG